MKEPTTPYSIAVHEKRQITRTFLEKEGWKLRQEFPLYDCFEHRSDPKITCGIGLYGEFTLTQEHWLNPEPERVFTTMNPDLTIEDYRTIIRLLKLKI